MRAGLRNHWHALATFDEVGEQPRQFRLLSEDLVAFATSDGVSVFRDLCIHRGTALSLGFVENGNLRCGYHGWAYDRTGTCVDIPSLPPGAPIPPKARAIAYRSEIRYGLVWVAMDEPVDDIPEFPADEWSDRGFRTFVSHHYVWNSSAGRAVENFMDTSHFAFVHEGVLGSRDNTEIAEHKVERRGPGLYFYVEAPEPANLHSRPGDVIRWEYFLTGPFTIHLKKTVPSGDVTMISLTASPTSDKLTDMFLWIARNHDLDPGQDDEYARFTHGIMEQDRLIVESQRPEEIPLDLREELHLKVPDASGIAYRRLLGDIDGVGAFMP